MDLRKLRRAFRRYCRTRPWGVVTGHLAHLLPVSYVVVLRCNPLELGRRLRRAGRTPRDVESNCLAEALDTVLVEALEAGRPVREVDTSGRSVTEVALEVERIVRTRPPARYGRLDWLSDPRVTKHLLPRSA